MKSKLLHKEVPQLTLYVIRSIHAISCDASQQENELMEQQGRLSGLQWLTQRGTRVLVLLVGLDDVVGFEEGVLISGHGGDGGLQEFLERFYVEHVGDQVLGTGELEETTGYHGEVLVLNVTPVQDLRKLYEDEEHTFLPALKFQ